MPKKKIGDIKITSEQGKTLRELVEEGKIKLVPHYSTKTKKWTVKAVKVK